MYIENIYFVLPAHKTICVIMNYICNTGRAIVGKNKQTQSYCMYEVLCFESWGFVLIKPFSDGGAFVTQLEKVKVIEANKL